MNTNRLLTVALFLALVLSLWISGRPIEAQAPNIAFGRYQMTAFGDPGNTILYVCDTHTSQCWSKRPDIGQKNWTDLGNPASDEQ